MFYLDTIMLTKKLCLVALIAFGCNSDPDTTKIDETPKEPVQYGTPFAGVPDPQDAVFYEVNIRAFSPSGDLQGVIDRLDNIKALGVNTIWLMPIFPVGQIKSAGGLGSPYSVRDYTAVNSEFGDLAKLRTLVDKAHEKNMAVILDWVANHTAWDNPWISNKDWYTQDGSGNIIIPPGTNWQDVADLNYANNDMRKAMIAAMKYWVLEANIDGFRCDAVDFVPADFWKQAINQLKSIEGRELILLAEGGKKENFTSGFQMNYAWDFYSNLKAVYGSNKAATSIFTTHQSEFANLPAGALKLRYTTNHDESAWEGTPMTFFQGKKGAISASVITIFTSATPLIYGSQEVGQSAKLPFFTREPIAWSSNQDMENAYKSLFSLYHESQAFVKGTLEDFSTNDLAIFRRKLDNDEYLFIVNVRGTNTDYTASEAFKTSSWTKAIEKTDFTFDSTITLTPYQYIILKRN
jgi:glycosidase